MGTTGEVGNVDPSLSYIMQFTNAVELYQKKNCNCFGCGSPDHLPKGNGKNCQEGRFKLERGDGKEGRPVLSEISSYARGHPS